MSEFNTASHLVYWIMALLVSLSCLHLAARFVGRPLRPWPLEDTDLSAVGRPVRLYGAAIALVVAIACQASLTLDLRDHGDQAIVVVSVPAGWLAVIGYAIRLWRSPGAG